MRKLLLFLPLAFLLSFVPKDVLTKKERKFAKEHLKQSRKDLLALVKGLSDAQLKFKPDADQWSIEECLKHIAISESNIWKAAEDGLGQPPNPEKRAEIKMTDEQIVTMVADRSGKFKTSERFEPKNTPFQSAGDAIQYFKENRDRLIKYIDDTQEDMRSHVITFPVGMLDAYQLVLFISAHTNRHAAQIREVMAHPNYPK